MIPREIVQMIDRIDVVYANFITTPLAQLVAGQAPSDYRVTTIQKIAQRGINTLGAMKSIIRDCDELRIDMGKFSILITDLGQAIHFALIADKNKTDFVSDEISKYKSVELNHPLIPPEDPDPTDIIDDKRYTHEIKIGEGGTAMVYRATDTLLRRPVAIKRFKDKGDLGIKGDYLSELQSVSRVRHPNVISTYDAGVDGYGSFIVMELIEGQDLEALLTKGPLSTDQFMDIAIQSLEGLEATHNADLLHLDIKSSNIMVSPQLSGRYHVKLIDYGRARLKTHPTTGEPPNGEGLMGSIFSLSPEFLSEAPLNERSDIYSLGCVFYRCLSGERPFNGESPLSVMCSHMQGNVRDLAAINANLPTELCAWVMGMIDKNPAKRPTSAKEALAQLLSINKEGKISQKIHVVAR